MPDLEQVAVRVQHQAIHHLDHVQARAQRGIHRTHFETDAAAGEACGQRAVEHAVIVRRTSDCARCLAARTTSRRACS